MSNLKLCLAAFIITLAMPCWAEFNPNLHQKTLDNGLKIAVLEKKSVPVVSVQVWYKVGSYHEKEGLRGMAHLFEHMMFRGSKNVGDEEHTQLIEAIGGRSNAYTADDMTVYLQTLPSKEVELAIKLEAERMEHLIVDSARLEKEREVVKEEYRWRYENNPYGDIHRKLRGFMFKNSQYEIGPIGLLDDISDFDVQKCQAFYNTFYAPNNALLVVVGDVDHAHIFALAEQYFGAQKRSALPEMAAYKKAKKKVKKVKSNSQIPRFISVFNFQVPEAAHPDHDAIQVLISALGSGGNSRLYQRLVRQRKLAYHFYSVDYTLNHDGVYAFALFHDKKAYKKIKKALFEELNEIASEGLSDDDFEKVKNGILSSTTSSLYSAESLARQIGTSWIYFEDPSAFKTVLTDMEKVSNEDIKRVTKKYFKSKHLQLVQFEPESKK